LSNNKQQIFVPCGIVAGIMARTDVTDGVWKAPAGISANIIGITALQVQLTDTDNGVLNPQGINCLRDFAMYGPVIWGARTLGGSDETDDYKYVNVRRMALYIEQSLIQGLQWVVFEPNGPGTWSKIVLSITSFLQVMYQGGAFFGAKASQAFFVKCDSTTTTANDIENGIINISIGFAPVKPAEFVILTIRQMAGQNSI
jgi:phage tail sheath protein FI